jgi:transcriptional regulator with XRE-family HTH domain
MNNADKLTVGARVVALREGLGMSQARLAERLGVADARISHYETGRAQLPIDIAIRLAKLTKTSLDHIYAGRRAPR